MNLMEKHSPFDIAPDWKGQTYYVRACDCLTMLELLGVISNKEHLEYHTKLNTWIHLT